jgi:hypothetical protein
MNGPGARSGQAHPQPAGGFGIAGGHKGCCFLVMDEDEVDLVLIAPQAFCDPIDSVARYPEDGVDAPVDQPLDKQFCGNLGHCLLQLMWMESPRNIGIDCRPGPRDM